jgi:hypothetical protein
MSDNEGVLMRPTIAISILLSTAMAATPAAAPTHTSERDTDVRTAIPHDVLVVGEIAAGKSSVIKLLAHRGGGGLDGGTNLEYRPYTWTETDEKAWWSSQAVYHVHLHVF